MSPSPTPNKRLQKRDACRVRHHRHRAARVTLSQFAHAVRGHACKVCDAELKNGFEAEIGDWHDGTGDYIGSREPSGVDKSRVEFMPVKGGALWGTFLNVTGAASNPKRPTRADWQRR